MTDERARSQSAFADRIRAWAASDFDGLQNAAEEVARLIDSPGWETIQKLVNDRAALMFNASVQSRVREQVEYVADAGEVRGLRQAVDAPGVLLAVYRDELKKRKASASRETR